MAGKGHGEDPNLVREMQIVESHVVVLRPIASAVSVSAANAVSIGEPPLMMAMMAGGGQSVTSRYLVEH